MIPPVMHEKRPAEAGLAGAATRSRRLLVGGSNLSAAEFMQYRMPVGSGPSGKHVAQMRVARGAHDLGPAHPERVVASRGRSPCATGARTTASRCRTRTSRPTRTAACRSRRSDRCRCDGCPSSSPENARSVPFLRVTRNCSLVSCAFHSASLLCTLSTMGFLGFVGWTRFPRRRRRAPRAYAIVSPFRRAAYTSRADRAPACPWIRPPPTRSAATCA